MKKQFLLFFALLFITIHQSFAQNNYQEIVDEFFKIYKTEPVKAVDYVFKTNKWMDRNIDGIENVKNQLIKFVPLMGYYYGFEKLLEVKKGKSLVHLSYIAKYDRQPIRFSFFFYNPNGTWQLQNFKFDDSLDDELEEAAKLNKQN